MNKILIVDIKNHSYDEPELELVNTLDEAADIVEQFMGDKGFTLIDGVLSDQESKTDTFEDVVYHNGRVIGFIHKNGPCVDILEGKTTILRGKKK